MKRNKKAILRSRCDKLWDLKYLKERCEICGSSYHLQGHHYYFKSNYGHLRYSKENHITLCRPCHFALHNQDPKKIEEQIIEKRGKSWYNRLKKKAQNPPPNYKITLGWYREAIEKLK